MNSLFKKIIINQKLFCIIILIFSLVMNLLIDALRFPGIITYMNDLLLVFSFLWTILSKKKFCIKIIKKFKYLFISLVFFFFSCVISSIINLSSPLLFLWGARNTFRGFIYFFLILVLFNENDINRIFSFLYILQFISLILCLYQLIILNHHQDEIGGIFGYGNGSLLNVFNIMMVSYYVSLYFLGKGSLIKMIITLLISFVVAGIAEEKMTFLFTIIAILVIFICVKGKLKQKLLTISFAIILLSFGLSIVKFLYPKMYFMMIDFESLFQYSQTVYDEGYRLPRIGSFPIISDLFFGNHFLKMIFGIGFGNADTSSFSFLQSEFYIKYGEYNYRWFVSQWMFIEQGYFGVFNFVMIFLCALVILAKKIRHKNSNNHLLIVGIVMVMYSIVSIWYNPTLKNDASYLLYFSIAVGFVAIKNKEGVKKYVPKIVNNYSLL